MSDSWKRLSSAARLALTGHVAAPERSGTMPLQPACDSDFCADSSLSPSTVNKPPEPARSRPGFSPATPSLTWLLAVLGICLLILANTSLNDQRFGIFVALVLVAGIAIWAVFGGQLERLLCRPTADNQPREQGTPVRPQWLFLSLSVLCGVGAVSWSADNQFRTAGVLCWIGAIAFWIAAWWPASAIPFRSVRFLRTVPVSDATTPLFAKKPSRRNLALLLGMLLIVATGAFFFFYQIDQTPRDPTSDHAEKLADVETILDAGRPIFLENNTGREPMQFYVIATMVEWFGSPLNFTTMKVGTAFIGLLAIPFVYLLAAELGGIAAGLAASLLFAIGKWPIEVSRAGLRFPYGMTFAAITLWFLLRWTRTGDRRDALACGLALGAGLYGYSPFRAVVPVVAAGFCLLLVAPTRAVTRRRAFTHGLLTAVTALVVFLPLGRYAIDKPDNFWLRSTSRIAGEEDSSSLRNALHHLSLFLENVWHAALAFNYRGDSTMVNAVTYDPFLDVVTGALLIAGLTTAVLRVVRQHDRALLLTLVAIPVLFLPSTLALGFPHENPSVNRAGAAIPVIFAIAAMPVSVLARAVLRTGQPRRLAATGALLLITLIGIAAHENFQRFYRDFDAQSRSIVVNTTEIATAIHGAAAFGVDLEDIWIVDRAYWLDIRNIGLTLGNLGWAYDHNIAVGEPLPEQRPGEPLLLVVHPDDTDRLASLRQQFPTGRLSHVPTELPWQSFVFYLVPADPVAANPADPGVPLPENLIIDELDP
ncbi:MAG: ArnT family glycosyltransferase [Thermomicrobiales bacterium]